MDGFAPSFPSLELGWRSSENGHRISGLDLNPTSDFSKLYNADAWRD
jgi:hypothetical protein